jgi:hypothetical protein
MVSANFPRKGTHVRRKADGTIGEVYASDPFKGVLTVRWRTATGFLTQVCTSEHFARDWELAPTTFSLPRVPLASPGIDMQTTQGNSSYSSIFLKRLLVIGLAVMGVGFLWHAAGTSSDKTSPSTIESSQPSTALQSPDAPAQPQPLQVSAVHLWRDYQRNEISADSMYKGKTLAVKGTVVAINKDFLDQAFLLLDTPNEFERVQAHLQKSEVSKASTLSPGVVVTVNCEGGGMTLGSPMLKDCVIQ